MAGVAAVLGIAGPFDTGAVMPLLPRLAYWLVVVTMTYAIGYFTSEALGRWIGPRLPVPAKIAAIGLVAGLAIGLFMIALNGAVFPVRSSWSDLPPFLATTCGIAAVVTAVMYYAGPEATPESQTPAILERLPLDKRGPILALSVEDHYVRVRTAKGEEMVLMRLSDAIRETGPTPGLQVHRSHWVATSAVTAARRIGDRAVLTLTSGDEIPVSRSNLPQVRDMGLLPK